MALEACSYAIVPSEMDLHSCGAKSSVSEYLAAAAQVGAGGMPGRALRRQYNYKLQVALGPLSEVARGMDACGRCMVMPRDRVAACLVL